jgi:rod shape-determining protein MreC
VGVAELASWNMEYVPSRSDILQGDRVVTSGLGGVYPPGITVGTVRSVDDGPLTMKVKLDLAVDPSTAEQVFVVLSSRPIAPAAPQPGPAPDRAGGRNG